MYACAAVRGRMGRYPGKTVLWLTAIRKWMIERMAKDAPQSLPYPVNADRIYPAGKGKGINKKDDARSDPDFKDGTACLH